MHSIRNTCIRVYETCEDVCTCHVRSKKKQCSFRLWMCDWPRLAADSVTKLRESSGVRLKCKIQRNMGLLPVISLSHFM